MSQLDKAHILIVDDSITIRNSISRYLGDNYIILQANNGEEAWQLIKSNNSISLIFADLHMPVMNGMALLKRIRHSKNTRITNLPVIMITGHEDTEAAKRASYNMGASEFISKPFSELDIISRVNFYLQLTQKIASLEQNITHDDLTGLYNTAGFQELGDQALAGALRHKYDLSILNMQITGIEDVLRKYGKKITSQIILAVSRGMLKSLRKEESIAHLGMGQFAMLLPLTKMFRAQIVAQRFQKTVSTLAFKIGTETIKLNLAMGINSTEDYAEEISFADLSMHTEFAMQESLNNQFNKMVRYDPALVSNSSSELVNNSHIEASTKNDSTKRSLKENAESNDFQMLNTIAFSRYMSMILNGEFHKIPEQDIKGLVEPLQSFLNFIEENKKSTLEEIIQ